MYPVLTLSPVFLAHLLAFSWWYFGLSHWRRNPETLVGLGIRHRSWYFAVTAVPERAGAQDYYYPWNEMLTEQS